MPTPEQDSATRHVVVRDAAARARYCEWRFERRLDIAAQFIAGVIGHDPLALKHAAADGEAAEDLCSHALELADKLIAVSEHTHD